MAWGLPQLTIEHKAPDPADEEFEKLPWHVRFYIEQKNDRKTVWGLATVTSLVIGCFICPFLPLAIAAVPCGLLGHTLTKPVPPCDLSQYEIPRKYK